MDPYLNETAASLPTSTTFKAPGNVVTINILWFTSLVLALAAGVTSVAILTLPGFIMFGEVQAGAALAGFTIPSLLIM